MKIFGISCFLQIFLTMGVKCPPPKCPPSKPKKPIPIHCDQITGKPKYVDPAHRNCVQGYKAPNFTPKNKYDKYNGRTHNCIAAVTTYSGERYGVLLSIFLCILFLLHATFNYF